MVASFIWEYEYDLARESVIGYNYMYLGNVSLDQSVLFQFRSEETQNLKFYIIGSR